MILPLIDSVGTHGAASVLRPPSELLGLLGQLVADGVDVLDDELEDACAGGLETEATNDLEGGVDDEARSAAHPLLDSVADGLVVAALVLLGGAGEEVDDACCPSLAVKVLDAARGKLEDPGRASVEERGGVGRVGGRR